MTGGAEKADDWRRHDGVWFGGSTEWGVLVRRRAGIGLTVGGSGGSMFVKLTPDQASHLGKLLIDAAQAQEGGAS